MSGIVPTTNIARANITLEIGLLKDLILIKIMQISSNLPKLIIAIPSFNDWEALHLLLLQADQINLNQNIDLEILVIDDFSTTPIPKSFITQEYQQIKLVSILRLRRNVGHQRAISVGLCYIFDNIDCDWVVVMDGDGEDNPFEIERLLVNSKKTGNNTIIFARRSKRSETKTFKFFYYLYRKIFYFLVGRETNVGNFSLVPKFLLKNIVVVSEIWNHYSSAIYRSRIPYIEVDIPRTRRLAGTPKMNLVSLITHGLSSISVYVDIVGTRLLLLIVFLLMFLLACLFIVVVIRLVTNLAIPGWATYVSGLLLISIVQLALLGTIFCIIILSARNQTNFIPIRDYKYFVDNFCTLRP